MIFLRDGHYYKQLKLQGNVQFYPNSAGEELGVRAVKEMTQCHRVSTEEIDTSVFGVCLCYPSQSFLFSVCLKCELGQKNQMKQKAKALFYWLFSVAGVLEGQDHTGVEGKLRTQQTLLEQFSYCCSKSKLF